MRLLPPGTPVRHPLLAAVRRRHPDVDLVLLRPPPRPERPPVPLTRAGAAGLRADLAAHAVRLWPGTAVPTTYLRYGAGEDTVRAVARVSARPADPVALEAALRRDVPSVPAPGTSARITRAATTGLVVLTLTSDVVVGADRARSLVRAGDR